MAAKIAKISPLPPEPIEVWIGASAAVAIDRAARMGDVWLADPGLTLNGAEAALAQYHLALQKHQIKLPATVAIRRDIYVAESSAEAAELRTSLGNNYRGFDPPGTDYRGRIDSRRAISGFRKTWLYRHYRSQPAPRPGVCHCIHRSTKAGQGHGRQLLLTGPGSRTYLPLRTPKSGLPLRIGGHQKKLVVSGREKVNKASVTPSSRPIMRLRIASKA